MMVGFGNVVKVDQKKVKTVFRGWGDMELFKNSKFLLLV
jgi:hypothetical protein